MIVPRKNGHQPIRLNQRFHEVVVGMCVAINTRTVSLMSNDVVVDAWLGGFGAEGLLECACGLHGDVYEGEAGNDTVVLLGELVVGLFEPSYDLCWISKWMWSLDVEK